MFRNQAVWDFRWWLADKIMSGSRWVDYRLRFSKRTRIQSAAWAKNQEPHDY